jgi:hypothetical protein
MWKSALILIGIALLGIGGWLQSTQPDYNRVRELLHLGNVSVSVREKEPVPGWLIAACFIGGVVTLFTGIYGER